MLSKPRLKMRFTMIELLAVITITAILLTMTMKVMKTDSTKSNATVIGSALKYAQSYALSKLDPADSDGDGVVDEYVKVSLVKSNGQLTISKENLATGAAPEIILEERLVAGSSIDADLVVGFKINGEPIDSSLNALSSNQVITIKDNRNEDQEFTVTLKPFTGKVTYY